MEIILETIIGIGILVFSAILHELAHGYMADRLGDPTPRLSGRLTLNPKNHIDPFMSIILPGLLMLSGSPVIFGGAKPVPVDSFNLKDGRKDIALVALVGPLTNIIIAIAAAGLIKITIISSINHPLLMLVFNKIVDINLILGIFNILPIPPLDGSKLFALIMPEEHANYYLAIGRFGTFILLFLLITPIGGFLQQIIFNIFLLARSILIP
ncbi:MAG: site-2 protease family protein [Candidatus Levybacteria bacterium]|nr:site-2 protease family protein [Candidatus Levybacteria bacterium]